MLLDRKIDATQLEPFVSQWLCEQLLLSAEPVNQELVSAVQAGARCALLAELSFNLCCSSEIH